MGSEVKRYDLYVDYSGEHANASMDEDRNGDWVRHADYADLAAKLERAEAVLRVLEWSSPNSYGHSVLCPRCLKHKGEKHAPDCDLSAIIDPKEPPHAP